MAKGTDYTGTTGRFGARYGVRIRRRIRDIEEEQRDDHLCPGCGHEKVTREASGIWQCDKCDHKFAGGAYTPETASFRTSQRQLKEALADEGGPETQEETSSQVLDDEDVVEPGQALDFDEDDAAGSQGDEPDEPDEADDEPADEELQLDDDVPEVDVPELEDIPEVQGLEEPDEEDEAAEDDDVVPEADLNPDREEEE